GWPWTPSHLELTTDILAALALRLGITLRSSPREHVRSRPREYVVVGHARPNRGGARRRARVRRRRRVVVRREAGRCDRERRQRVTVDDRGARRVELRGPRVPVAPLALRHGPAPRARVRPCVPGAGR